jgi:two-component system sensor histidine kinase MtrB
LASSQPSTPEEAQTLLWDLHSTLLSSGSTTREVFVWKSPGTSETSTFSDLSSEAAYDSLITPQMRAATVAAGGGQVRQSVAKPVDPGTSHSPVVPGVVIGSTVAVPGAGIFELYYLYDLRGDEETLQFIQSVLLGGALVLLALLVAIIALMTRQTVRPVRAAARVAQRLADGHLDERLPVRRHDELATLGRSFNAMAQGLQEQVNRMEELSALQRRFVSDVSHELRTPLTTVRMASEVLYAERDAFDPAAKRSAELLQAQLDRFEELLADLLEISRFDAGAAVLDAESRDLRDVVATAVNGALPLAERKHVWLSVHLGEEPATADIDPRRVERVVRNLLANAVDHAEDKPVEVRVAADPHAVAVVVRDYGVGMRAEEVERVFDRFWRADPARARTTGGTGLGLAISAEDAHLHGGWLDAWGRPGQGASFRLTLPRRAGIRLVSSPLALVPDTDQVARGAILVSASDGIGPAALPDIAVVPDDSLDPQES